MSEMAVAFHSVSKSFHTDNGVISALRDVTLDIPPHTFTAIVGPSGCGKTTLLHIAAGLDTRFEGELVVRAPRDRRAYLFQSPRLLPWMTAEQNVAFVREARGDNRKQALTAAREYLERVGLGAALTRYPMHLSGGMQQRVAMARALVVEPELMLMDEPFSALDELTARKLRTELSELSVRTRRTVLFVTHNVTEAAYFADRVIVITPRPGRIVADIAVALERPRDYDDPNVAITARKIVNHLALPD